MPPRVATLRIVPALLLAVLAFLAPASRGPGRMAAIATSPPTNLPTNPPTATDPPPHDPSLLALIFTPTIAGAVPKITLVLSGSSQTLTPPELAALKDGFVDKLQAESDEPFVARSNIVVELSSGSPIKASAFFKPGSGVGIADAHAIVTAIEAGSNGHAHFVTPDNGTTIYPILSASASHEAPPQTVTMSPTPSPTPSPSPSTSLAPSFSPVGAGAVPKITLVLSGSSQTLTPPELAALKDGFVDKLQAESDEPFVARSNIVVELSSGSPIKASAFFKPGSGVGIADAHAIVTAIEAGSNGHAHFVTPDNGMTIYPIYSVKQATNAALPRTLVPSPAPVVYFSPMSAPTTSEPTPTPTPAPTTSEPSLAPTTWFTLTPMPAPTSSVPPCAPTTSLSPPDYCPCGYHDYGVRFSLGLGRITVVRAHQECADRCSTYSGVQYSGGCRGYMTGMYMGMLFCRSYGSGVRTTQCPLWANIDSRGSYSGPLGSVHAATNQRNVGGNCCSNTTFVDGAGG